MSVCVVARTTAIGKTSKSATNFRIGNESVHDFAQVTKTHMWNSPTLSFDDVTWYEYVRVAQHVREGRGDDALRHVESIAHRDRHDSSPYG